MDLKQQMDAGQQPPREPGSINIQCDGANFNMRAEKLSKLEIYAVLKILMEKFEKDLGIS